MHACGRASAVGERRPEREAREREPRERERGRERESHPNGWHERVVLTSRLTNAVAVELEAWRVCDRGFTFALAGVSMGDCRG